MQEEPPPHTHPQPHCVLNTFDRHRAKLYLNTHVSVLLMTRFNPSPHKGMHTPDHVQLTELVYADPGP